ncbi:hypothetical protein BPAE_0082g00400 [Botrytis paeoniae]|uniref:Uncharacterized protein n=1 Tax=Botrytis paeoniae TaxID=278948 RepID=A0A4Z1FKM0_9HELO|nr:hypothetical protein BPAE_0082g00400 [Botrytis paeoniae]
MLLNKTPPVKPPKLKSHTPQPDKPFHLILQKKKYRIIDALSRHVRIDVRGGTIQSTTHRLRIHTKVK